MRIFKKKTWVNKKVQKWNGKDLLKATGFMTLIGTVLAAIPFVGILIKEDS